MTNIEEMDTQPIISIVIPNWNGRAYIDACITSIENQTFRNYELIVIDNGSTDDSVEYLRGSSYDMKIVVNADNNGFAAAVNQGINESHGRYVFVLNNDTVLEANCLRLLLEYAEKHPTTGMIAPKILRKDTAGIIDSVGINIYPDGTSRGRGREEHDAGQYDGVVDVLLPSGCAALYRMDMLQTIGLFDEKFYLYCEDTDIGLRGRLAGWDAVLQSDAIVYHKYSMSAGMASSQKLYYVERNRLWVLWKNFPWPWLLLAPFFTLFRYMVQFVYAHRANSTGLQYRSHHTWFDAGKTILKAHFDALSQLPDMWKKRRAIRQTKTVSTQQFTRWLHTYRLKHSALQ